jgi:hypothetical protein
MVLMLCLPARKWGNHVYVAFPLLGALAGCAAAGLLSRARFLPAAVAAAAVVFLASNAGRRIMRPPCAFSTSLARPLGELPARAPILVVAKVQDDAVIAELAAERDFEPFAAAELPQDGPFHFALARDNVPTVDSWRVRASGGGWILLQR